MRARFYSRTWRSYRGEAVPSSSHEFPSAPKDESREELGFQPQPMVRWFDPVQLAGTGIQVGVSGFFGGSNADKREIQAALAPAAANREYAEGDELWIDYVADLGDGFDPTYTVAWLLAAHAHGRR